MAAPAMDTAEYTPIARFRSVPSGKVTAISDSEAGAASAPPMPWMARAVSSHAWSVASPPASEASANSAMPAMKQQPAEGQRVGIDDPFQVRPREVQRVPDVRQRDVNDRRIEDDHELRG